MIRKARRNRRGQKDYSYKSERTMDNSLEIAVARDGDALAALIAQREDLAAHALEPAARPAR
jgi:phage shock protein A